MQYEWDFMRSVLSVGSDLFHQIEAGNKRPPNISIQILKMWRPVMAASLGYLMQFPTQVLNIKDPQITKTSTTGVNMHNILLTSEW